MTSHLPSCRIRSAVGTISSFVIWIILYPCILSTSLFLKDIFNDVNSNYYKWFDNNIEKLDLDGLFDDVDKRIISSELLNFEIHKTNKFTVNDIIKYYQYLRVVNKWIEKRTNILINKIII